MDAVATAKEKMTKTISVLERDLGTLKAGRANPQALDRIFVDYYGSPMPIPLRRKYDKGYREGHTEVRPGHQPQQ